MTIPPTSLEELDELITALRERGVDEFSSGDFKLKLGELPMKPEPPPPAPQVEQVDPNTGLTPSQSSDWFYSSGG